MTERKLILPTEVKVCATCTYWDGERNIDEEMRVVVVTETCTGECLVSESQTSALATGTPHCECLWDDLEGEAVTPEPEKKAASG